jgi:hypothetical protein
LDPDRAPGESAFGHNAAPHGDHVTEKIEFDRRDGQAVIATAMALIGRHWV